jgi:hypothetical protein
MRQKLSLNFGSQIKSVVILGINDITSGTMSFMDLDKLNYLILL